MSCEQLSERLPDYWAGRLSDAERRALDAHLAACEACRAEADALTDTWQALGALAADEPSPALRGRFDAMLDEWRDAHPPVASSSRGELTATPPKVVTMSAYDRGSAYDKASAYDTVDARPVFDARPRWSASHWRPALQIAAGLLLLAGGFIGGRFWPESAERREIARSEVTELRQELRDMRQMMTLTLLQQQSATERLRGVSWSAQVERPGGEVLDALLETLASDPNVNVRLATIEALTQFNQESRVRRSLVDELATRRQDSPLVQLALIDALVQLKERESVTAMRTLAADQKTNTAVRQRATWAADTLSKS